MKVISSTGGRKVTYKALTPSVCSAGGSHILTYSTGTCRVVVYVGGLPVRIISISARLNGEAVGDYVNYERLLFNGNASKVTKVAIAQMAALRSSLRRSSLVIVVGHAANDGGQIGSAASYLKSMRRAQKVAAHLRGLGVRNIQVSWQGNTVPVSKVNLRENRRVDLAWIEG